jgi:hypothetical protein
MTEDQKNQITEAIRLVDGAKYHLERSIKVNSTDESKGATWRLADALGHLSTILPTAQGIRTFTGRGFIIAEKKDIDSEVREELIKSKYKMYLEYLKGLTDEYLGFEFNDQMGCDPVAYYSNAKNWDNEAEWERTLLDKMANDLFDNPMIDPINQEYKEKSEEIRR